MKYSVTYTNQFLKDVRLCKKQGKNMDKLFAVVEQIADGLPLPVKNSDHFLEGNYGGCRECHIEPDWLLIYRLHKEQVQLVLLRTGSHARLF